MQSYPKQLLITANSPGEVAGWLSPILSAVRKRWKDCRVTVILLPCPFATGSEQRVLSENLHVDEVIPSRRFLSLLFKNPCRSKDAVLIHLGGDLMYSSALIWRWRIPAWSYLWGRFWWDWAFKGYFIKNHHNLTWLKNHHLPLEKAVHAGDLVADDVEYSMQDYLKNHALIAPNPNLISFLPGSRAIELENLSPFFLETAKIMKAQNPNLSFQMLLSPFIKPAQMVHALQADPHPAVGGIKGSITSRAAQDGSLEEYLSTDGAEIKLIRKHRLPNLSASAMCITIPGTKTAEAACLGVPELMILPLNRPECLPYIGILGLLDWIPGGREIKGRILMKMRGKVGFQALPNILVQKPVIPELIDVLTPEMTAERALSIFNDKDELNIQKDTLKNMYAPFKGAADRILNTIEQYISSI